MKKIVSVKVKGRWVPIEYSEYELYHDDGPVDGLYLRDKSKIVIANHFDNLEEEKDTLIHEMFHAMIQKYGIRDLISERAEEKICCDAARFLSKIMVFDQKSKYLRWKNL